MPALLFIHTGLRFNIENACASTGQIRPGRGIGHKISQSEPIAGAASERTRSMGKKQTHTREGAVRHMPLHPSTIRSAAGRGGARTHELFIQTQSIRSESARRPSLQASIVIPVDCRRLRLAGCG